MNIKKPVLTREQAERLEQLEKNAASTKEEIIEKHVNSEWSFKENRCFNDLSIKDFMTAVYYGYEIEQTAEEAAKQYYDCLNHRQRYSATKILNILGIKIEGINKEESK